MIESEDVKRTVVAGLILSIFVLAFLVIKPIIIPIILGLLFSYIFTPVYKLSQKVIKNKSISAFLLVLIIVLIVVIPVIYFVPSIVNQIFSIYTMVQNMNFSKIISGFVKTSSVSAIAINIDSIAGQFFSTVLNQFKEVLINLPSLTFQFAVFLFTFYFATRDGDKLGDYIRSLSPLSKTTELRFLEEFRGITNAIVFGQIFVGLAQSISLGIGLFVLGVPNVIFLSFIAFLLSIIPILGAWLVWLPTAIYLLSINRIFAGIALLIYGAFFVSLIDNFLRPYILSKKSNLPIAISLIGTIGGLFFFGIVGLLLGPLVLAYALIIIEFYRHGKLKDLFNKK